MQKKILLLGKRGGILQWYEHVLDSEQYLPEVNVYGYALNHNNWQDRSGKKLLKLVKNKAAVEQFTANKIKQQIERLKPELILITDLFYLSRPILDTLHSYKNKIKTAHWIGDFFDQRLTDSAEVIDQYYFTDSSFIEDARQLGIEHASYLPLAANPRLFHRPNTEGNRKNQLLFIGAYSENRANFIGNLDIPKTIIGKGWQTQGKNDEVLGRNIPLTQVSNLYQEHNYVLNVVNRDNTRFGLNMRCFEVTACGAVLLTEDSPDMIKNYAPGEDVIVYSSAEELKSAVEQLQQDLKAQALVANNGHQRCMAEHCYHHRIQSILND